MPANVPAFAWWSGPSSDFGCPSVTAGPDDVRLVRLTAGGDVPLGVLVEGDAAGYIVRPQTPLAPGERYRLVGGSLCTQTERFGPSARSVTFETGARAPLPSSLGVVVAGSPQQGMIPVQSLRGSCSAAVFAAAVEVTARLSTEAQPWAAMLSYETLVDGVVWTHRRSLCQSTEHGESPFGRGRDVVYAVCESADPSVERTLSPGAHTVQFRATLAGVAAPIVTAPLTVDLRCTGVTTDAGLNFAESGVADAGPSPPAARDADVDLGPAVTPHTARGGCHSAPGVSHGALAPAAWAFAWMMSRRRRARLA